MEEVRNQNTDENENEEVVKHNEVWNQPMSCLEKKIISITTDFSVQKKIDAV